MKYAAVVALGRTGRRRDDAAVFCAAAERYRPPPQASLSWSNLFGAAVFLVLLLNAAAVRAEYCVNWSAVVQQHSGSSGHCWPTKSECTSYYNSRVMSGYRNDFSGDCYYRPGKYPREGAKPSGPAQPGSTNRGVAAQQKFKAQERAYDTQQQQQFQRQKETLLRGLKGENVTPENTLMLKRPPASGFGAGTARKQLDCVVHKSGEKRGGNWEQTTDCTPVKPQVPAVPPPMPVPLPAGH